MEEINKVVEDKRAEFMRIYKKQRMLNNIVTVAVLLVVISAYVFIQGMLHKQYLTLGIIALTLILLFVYSSITRKKLNQQTQDYIKNYYDLLAQKTFPGDKYQNVTMDALIKLDEKEVIEAGIIKGVLRIGSRGFAQAKLGDRQITLSDVAAYTTTDRKKGPVFVGKFITCPNHMQDDGRILVYVKSKNGKGPDDIDGLETVSTNEKYVIYSSVKDYKKIINEKILTLIDSFAVDDTLADVAISIKPGKTYVALSYSDQVMVIPLQTQFDPKYTDKYCQDVEKIAEIFANIE